MEHPHPHTCRPQTGYSWTNSVPQGATVKESLPVLGAPETRTADEILRDPETYEMIETLLYLTEDGHLTETPTETVAGVYTLKATSDARIAELEAQIALLCEADTTT